MVEKEEEEEVGVVEEEGGVGEEGRGEEKELQDEEKDEEREEGRGGEGEAVRLERRGEVRRKREGSELHMMLLSVFLVSSNVQHKHKQQQQQHK